MQNVEYSDAERSVPGTCEICGTYVEYLDEVDGKFVCESCKEDLKGE